MASPATVPRKARTLVYQIPAMGEGPDSNG